MQTSRSSNYTITKTIPTVQKLSSPAQKAPYVETGSQVQEILQKISELPGFPFNLLEKLEKWKAQTLEADFDAAKLQGDEEARLVAAEDLAELIVDTINPAIDLDVLLDELENFKDELTSIIANLLPGIDAEAFVLEFEVADIQTKSFCAKMDHISQEDEKIRKNFTANCQKIVTEALKNQEESKKALSFHITLWQIETKKEEEKLLPALQKANALIDKQLQCCHEASVISDDQGKQQIKEKAVTSKLRDLLKKEGIR